MGDEPRRRIWTRNEYHLAAQAGLFRPDERLELIDGAVIEKIESRRLALPNLNIIIGHMGENLPFSIARADAVLSRTAGHLQRSVIEYFGSNFYVTTSGYFTIPPFLCALMVVGADRLLFSVDYPYSDNTRGVAFLKSLPVSGDDLQKIAYRNAEKLLKI